MHRSRAGRRRGRVADWLLVPFTLTRLLFPVMLLVAAFLLLRGHDLPGGGFSAGMVVAIAVILQYMIGGTDWTEDRLRGCGRGSGSAPGCCWPSAPGLPPGPSAGPS